MGEAAQAFLAALSTDQRVTAQLDFADHEERTTWYYTPTERKGLPFTQMERNQQRLAQQLVMSGLSTGGYNTATTIMGLETLLDGKEGFARDPFWRDSRLYHLTIFGTPDSTGTWGWRFEGHHISLNYTLVDGKIVAPTPTFFGANPAESPLIGPHSLRPLATIEDLARDLMHAFGAEQRSQALLTTMAPPDVVMLNRPYVLDGALPARTPGINDTSAVASQFRTMDQLMAERGTKSEEMEAIRYSTTPKGIAAAAMSAAQQEILLTLIGDYVGRMPEELAEIELAALNARGIDGLHFAWAGGIERREAHYYRIQGPRFLVEYDNTQNDANHIHSVWRDPENDFGADLLAQHYATAH